jgi:hypothetical protein
LLLQQGYLVLELGRMGLGLLVALHVLCQLLLQLVKLAGQHLLMNNTQAPVCEHMHL